VAAEDFNEIIIFKPIRSEEESLVRMVLQIDEICAGAPQGQILSLLFH